MYIHLNKYQNIFGANLVRNTILMLISIDRKGGLGLGTLFKSNFFMAYINFLLRCSPGLVI